MSVEEAIERSNIIKRAKETFDSFSPSRKAELTLGFQRAREEAQFIIDGGPNGNSPHKYFSI